MNEEEKKAIKEKDKENKAIRFYKNFIKNQEQELEWMYRQDEEYYRDEIEQKELLIKGFNQILNLIEKQKAEIEKKDKIIDLMAEEYSLKTDTNVLDICACCNYNNEDCHGDYCKETLIKYFEKKVGEE